MNAREIGRQSNRYLMQGIALTLVVAVVIGLLDRFTNLEGLMVPMMIGTAFAVVIIMAEALGWRRVATSHPDSLPTFFMAVSGFRLLLALATMFVYYLMDDGDTMMTFFLTFAAFYVMLLIHHSVFFARLSNHS